MTPGRQVVRTLVVTTTAEISNAIFKFFGSAKSGSHGIEVVGSAEPASKPPLMRTPRVEGIQGTALSSSFGAGNLRPVSDHQPTRAFKPEVARRTHTRPGSPDFLRWAPMSRVVANSAELKQPRSLLAARYCATAAHRPPSPFFRSRCR